MLPQYKGKLQQQEYTQEAWDSLVGTRVRNIIDPSGYLPDDGLIDAVNVALMLEQPLLLTGEPGTGKTQLAYSLAWEMRLGEPLKFETKSTSIAQDLFYTYDSLGRFQETYELLGSALTQNGNSFIDATHKERKEYITYNALGLAILYSNTPDVYRTWVPNDFEHIGPVRSVVLIDEVDKAPRDFPNDILNELGEEMYFRVPEIGMGNERISVNPSVRPIVIITSNSERNLPDAFLRRCVYYDIPFPSKDRLAKIVAGRLSMSDAENGLFLEDALDFFYSLRKLGLRKNPSTAELLGWLSILVGRDDVSINESLKDQLSRVEQSLGALVKTAEDLKATREHLKNW